MEVPFWKDAGIVMISLQPWASVWYWICTVKTQKKAKFSGLCHSFFAECQPQPAYTSCVFPAAANISVPFLKVMPLAGQLFPPPRTSSFYNTVPSRKHRIYSTYTNTKKMSLAGTTAVTSLFPQKSCQTDLPPEAIHTAVISAWPILSFISDSPYK